VLGLLLGMAIVLLGPIGFILVGSDGWRAHHGGVSGSLTVTGCEWHQRRVSSSWVCSGSFLSGDRSMRIASVELTDGEHRATGEQVAVLVSGRAAVKCVASIGPNVVGGADHDPASLHSRGSAWYEVI
jgi:hypothetical protein